MEEIVGLSNNDNDINLFDDMMRELLTGGPYATSSEKKVFSLLC
jgi:hypothetical protein